MSFFQKAFKWYSHYAAKHTALVGGFAFSGRYFFGDLIVQVAEDNPFDVRRSLTFLAFGFCYSTTIGYRVYNVGYMLPFFRTRPLLTAVFDLCGHCPFLYFPAFYIVQESIFTPIEQVFSHPLDTAKKALSRYSDNFVDDNKVCIAMWVPLHYINFRFVPARFRLSFMSATGLIWAVALSILRGDDKSKQLEEEEQNGQRLVAASEPRE